MDGAGHIPPSDGPEAMLAELAQLGMVMARDLSRRALAAEASDEAARLAAAFHKISRGVRQTLLLDAKLKRDAEAARLQAARDEGEIRQAAAERRRADVQVRLERIAFDENEDGYEYGKVENDIAILLDEEVQLEGFADEPLELQVPRLKAELDVRVRQRREIEAAEREDSQWFSEERRKAYATGHDPLGILDDS